jgi:hypothetical protein
MHEQLYSLPVCDWHNVPDLSPPTGYRTFAGPPSRVDLAGGLSMAEVKVESASVLPFALLKCGRLLTTDP